MSGPEEDRIERIAAGFGLVIAEARAGGADLVDVISAGGLALGRTLALVPEDAAMRVTASFGVMMRAAYRAERARVVREEDQVYVGGAAAKRRKARR